MRRSSAAALIAILLVAVLSRLLPLTQHLYWGSDIGEYHWLTSQVVESGHLGTDYDGWGATYPYFPGFYFITAGPSLIGFDVDAILSVVPPVLNALCVLLIFLISVRLFRDERVGLISAAVLAVAMPYVYGNSHSIPAAIGSVLVLGSLALLIGPRPGNGKLLIPLAMIAAALVVTHHLSVYFLIVMVLAAVFLRSMIQSRFSLRANGLELACIVIVLALALPYWLIYAVPFRENILGDLGTMPWWGPFALFGVSPLVWFGIMKLRQRSSWVYAPRYPDRRRCGAMLLIALLFCFGLTGLFVVVDVIGTTITISEYSLLFLSPLLVLLAFSASGRKFLDFVRSGLAPTGWFIGLSCSLVLGAFLGARVLIPYRHVDYILIPLAVMIGAGFVFLIDLTPMRKGGRMVAATLISVLMVANMPVAHPPPEIMAGYVEGASSQSLVAVSWLPSNVNGLLATDHKASTLSFGFGSTNATWDTIRMTLLSPDFAAAKDEMLLVRSPSGEKRVDFVLINADVKAGTQLYPWEPAYVMSDVAQSKFNDVPYQRIFDDGYSQVYWVNWGFS